MLFVRLLAGQWLGAVRAKIKLGLTRAMLRVMAGILVLLALGFGAAAITVALAAKFGVIWALGIVCVALLALAAIFALFARSVRELPIQPATIPTQPPPMMAPEIAFLAGFIAIRALMRHLEKSTPPPK